MNAMFLLLLVISTGTDAQQKLVVPEEWTRDFQIYVSSGGGMINESYKTTFYFDSCVYEKRVAQTKTKKCIRLNDSKRAEILKKLKGFKIDEVRTRTTTLKMDAGSTSICFYAGDKESCLTDGATVEVLEADYDKFSPAYQYLMAYAEPKKH